MNWWEYLFYAPVEAANRVRSNVWAVILVITGISLTTHGQPVAGGSLITGAFAILRSSPDTTPKGMTGASQ
jgi:hypothetical protein